MTGGEKKQTKLPECFVIMPISECDGYPPNHFLDVYEDIIVPACEMTHYRAIRADQVSATNFIQIDILNRLREAPLCICDLSTRNPNVLYELGIRQAFDMPVVLIQEEGTPRIFDISGIRCHEYGTDLRVKSVKSAINTLVSAIEETTRDGVGIQSIVKLMSITSAAVVSKTDGRENADIERLLLIEELRTLRQSVESLKRDMTAQPDAASHTAKNIRTGFKTKTDFMLELRGIILKVGERLNLDQSLGADEDKDLLISIKRLMGNAFCSNSLEKRLLKLNESVSNSNRAETRQWLMEIDSYLTKNGY